VLDDDINESSFRNPHKATVINRVEEARNVLVMPSSKFQKLSQRIGAPFSYSATQEEVSKQVTEFLADRIE
jgi:hypothetical protein